MAEASGSYVIEWASKPLGFSIVMDTTGKNAYVSSIQKESNKTKGLKLAAQIIKINGEDVKNLEHKKILEKIKKATLPIKLMFQPRSFANEPQAQQSPEVPPFMEFAGAEVNQHRINGGFELVKEKYMGKNQWQRQDEEEDPILLWFWPKQASDSASDNTTGNDLWMIGRKSQRNTEFGYACCPGDCDIPTAISGALWQCYDQNRKDPKTGLPAPGFVECKIHIKQNRQ